MSITESAAEINASSFVSEIGFWSSAEGRGDFENHSFVTNPLTSLWRLFVNYPGQIVEANLNPFQSYRSHYVWGRISIKDTSSFDTILLFSKGVQARTDLLDLKKYQEPLKSLLGKDMLTAST